MTMTEEKAPWPWWIRVDEITVRQIYLKTIAKGRSGFVNQLHRLSDIAADPNEPADRRRRAEQVCTQVARAVTAIDWRMRSVTLEIELLRMRRKCERAERWQARKQRVIAFARKLFGRTEQKSNPPTPQSDNPLRWN